jgi:mannose-6-phosphate isomerase
MELLFLEPIFKEKIWGGNRLKKVFNYNIPNDSVGEAWCISGHPHGSTTIKNGKFQNITLAQVWEQQPKLFANNISRPFPLLVKIIDAHQDLSVQVHPNDNYANIHENESGKSECWYVLDTLKNSQIVYGHNATTKDEFINLATTANWNKLLIQTKINVGDFFAVPTGVVHALGAGGLILEIQQSSDVTYRIFDYERKDSNGNLRELQFSKAMDVINIPHIDNNTTPTFTRLSADNYITHLTSNDYFQIKKLVVQGSIRYPNSYKYLLISAVKGQATINGYEVKNGDHFIVPNNTHTLEINGNIELIITNEN